MEVVTPTPRAQFKQLEAACRLTRSHINVNSDEAQLSHLAASSSTDHPGNLSHTGRNVHSSASISGINATIQNAFDTNRGGYHHLQDEPNLSGNPAASSQSPLDNNDPSVKPDVPIPIQSAADVVLKMYQSVRIDSTLCKKLAEEVARREPVQRRSDQKLNIRRRSNVEALLAHVTGEVAPRSCKNCRRGHGPWTQCVVYEGQMCGSCTNCWFNASGSRCTFHGKSFVFTRPTYFGLKSCPGFLVARQSTVTNIILLQNREQQSSALAVQSNWASGTSPAWCDAELSAASDPPIEFALGDSSVPERGYRPMGVERSCQEYGQQRHG